jgi:acyl-CoA ligase (AMP-forming) (exosortase A-associated)
MSELLDELIFTSAARLTGQPALLTPEKGLDYGELAELVGRAATGLQDLGVERFTRVAILAPKSVDTVAAFFAVARAGGIFVPVNPLLKAHQVGHILRDSGARVLIVNAARLPGIQGELEQCPELRQVVVLGKGAATGQNRSWDDVGATPAGGAAIGRLSTDPVSIFYTSGSTGSPKGVILSHLNMVTGAHSVASYLQNNSADRLLSVLPFSFDYGFSQLTTAFSVGASVRLLNYLFPQDVLKAGAEGITGLAGVPPLWLQLLDSSWPEAMRRDLRYITNSGGALPVSAVRRLQELLPSTDIYLMYGLTEAFRSSFLPPGELDQRPTSMGKAIPNAEILVVRPDGSECDAEETGELVHCGPLVAQGYWADEERTLARFKPAPRRLAGLPLPELAVWSGDLVRRDADGYLYFVGRNDELIKTSGYRVSPTEVEEALYGSGRIAGAVVFGIPDTALGQTVVAIVEATAGQSAEDAPVLDYCRRELANYMVPARLVWLEDLPRNPNGKLDRNHIVASYRQQLESSE